MQLLSLEPNPTVLSFLAEVKKAAFKTRLGTGWLKSPSPVLRWMHKRPLYSRSFASRLIQTF